jgi:hypothetical protein
LLVRKGDNKAELFRACEVHCWFGSVHRSRKAAEKRLKYLQKTYASDTRWQAIHELQEKEAHETERAPTVLMCGLVHQVLGLPFTD